MDNNSVPIKTPIGRKKIKTIQEQPNIGLSVSPTNNEVDSCYNEEKRKMAQTPQSTSKKSKIKSENSTSRAEKTPTAKKLSSKKRKEDSQFVDAEDKKDENEADEDPVMKAKIAEKMLKEQQKVNFGLTTGKT